MSYRAHSFIGVLASEVLRTKQTVTGVTKFNPDTGEPYIKETVEETIFLGDMDVTDEALYEVLEKREGRMQVFDVFDNKWMGIPFHKRVNEWDGFAETSPDEMIKVIEEAKAEFSKLGYTGNLICVLTMGYVG